MVLVGSQWSLVVVVASQRFSVVRSGSLFFLLVLVDSQWFSVVLVYSQ